MSKEQWFWDLKQGTPEWLDLRKQHKCASDAAVALGTSPYKNKRTYMLEQITGERAKVSSFTQELFAKGHAAEAEARPIAEIEVGSKLSPVVVTMGGFLASLDGISEDLQTIWEHKLSNQSLIDHIKSKRDLPDTHWPQVEHQLMVSGAKRCVFTVSDGTPFNTFHLWYESIPSRRQRVLNGWAELEKEMANVDLETLITVERDDSEWVQLARELSFETIQLDLQKKKVDQIKERLKKLAGEKRTQGAGVLVYPVSRTTTDHKQIIKDFDVDVSKYQSTSESWSIKISKPTKAAEGKAA